MSGAPHCDPAAPGGCAICGDEAVLARVLDVHADTRLATVVLLERSTANPAPGDSAVTPPSTLNPPPLAVALDLVDGIVADDVVLVHQGFVISRVHGT